MILLDTHTWFWLVTGEETVLDNLDDDWNEKINSLDLGISTVSFWEISMLHAKKRISLDQAVLSWLKQAITFQKLKVLDINPEIASDSCNLPGNFHSDPFDRIIVATARHYNATLFTRDRAIIKYASKRHLKVVPIKK